MEKESLEVIDSPEESINIVYSLPNFGKRVFANFMDIIFLFLAFISVFIVAQKITYVTPYYLQNDEVLATYREESGLFRYASSRQTWENISTFLDNNNDTSYSARVYQCQVAINDFIDYIAVKGSEEQYQEILTNYDESRLSPNLVDGNGVALFIKTTEDVEDPETHAITTIEKIVHNPNCNANGEYYYTHFYREYTLTNCGSYMLTFFPEYRQANQNISNIFFFVQIPVTLTLSVFIIYLLPAIIFRRGRSTFGKKLMQIGLVNSKMFSPTFLQYFARWAIFFFGEVVLSLFTFGVPFIISFSMMAFSKKRQGFPDYMLGLTEVDTKKQKIYYSKYEVAVDYSRNHKKPVDFNLIDKE